MSKELKLLEDGLIRVYVTSTGEKVVDGRELHEGLGSRRQFADWIKSRLEDVDAIENTDYICISQNCEKPSGGRPTIDYAIKLKIAKEMAMLERNETGKQYRRYFIEVEEKYNTQTKELTSKAALLLNIYDGGQGAIVASKQLVELELKPVIAERDEAQTEIKRIYSNFKKEDELSAWEIANEVTILSNKMLPHGKLVGAYLRSIELGRQVSSTQESGYTGLQWVYPASSIDKVKEYFSTFSVGMNKISIGGSKYSFIKFGKVA